MSKFLAPGLPVACGLTGLLLAGCGQSIRAELPATEPSQARYMTAAEVRAATDALEKARDQRQVADNSADDRR